MEMSNQVGRSLRGRWEAFTSLAPGESADAIHGEKLVRLEDFLHTFLLMSANPAIDREDLVNFCNDIHSVFNILTRQFFTDVQELAPLPPSSSCEGTPSLPAPMVEFLLHGRGWLTLNALCNLSNQALDFNPDFVSLLVHFIEEALRLPITDKSKDRNFNIPKLDCCILKRNFTKKSLMSIGFANCRRSTFRSHSASNSSSPNRLLSSRGSPSSWRKGNRDSSDSDAKGSTAEHGLSKKSRSDAAPKHVYSRQAPLPKSSFLGEVPIVDWQLSTGNHPNRVNCSDVDAFDFCLVLLSLLERLCISEVMHSSKRNTLALFLAPKLTNLLTYLESLSSETKASDQQNNRWPRDLICVLQRLVLRIVISLCMYSCTQHYEVPKLASSRILFTLLQLTKNAGQLAQVAEPHSQELVSPDGVAEDCTSNVHDTTESDSWTDQKSSDNLQWSHLPSTTVQYVSEILHGVILLLVGIMHSCCENQIVVTHAMTILNEFTTNGGYTVTESLLDFADEKMRHLGEAANDSQILKNCIVALLNSLSKLLIATKRAKLEYIHKFHCLKRTHNDCDYTHYIHHHHSMFGISYSLFEEDKLPRTISHSLPQDASDNPLFRVKRSKCCIAVIVEMLLGLLVKARYKGTTVRILFAIEQGGICCCLPPKFIVAVFLKSLAEHTVAMRSYLLSVLSKLILEQLGGSERTDGVIQGICEECTRHGIQSPPASSKKSKLAKHYTSCDSAICSDGSQQDEDIHLSKWKVLEQFTPLLLSPDEALSRQISGHLFHLVRHSNMTVKEELYFNVILSCFRQSDTDVIDGPQSLPCFNSPSVLEHIFGSLPHLLNTLSARKEFLEEGGLAQLVQLLDLPATRRHVLSVFEVLISSEECEGDLPKSRSRSNTKESILSTRTLSDNGDIRNVVRNFAEIVCTVLPYSPPKEIPKIGNEREQHETDEDWFQSCEVIEDPVEHNVYRSVQNRNLIEEGKAAFADSLKTIEEVDSLKEVSDTFEDILSIPDQLSRLSDEALAKAADVWQVSGNLIIHSLNFREQFLQKQGDVLAMGLFMEALVGLTRTWRMCEGLPVTWSPFNDYVARLRTVSEYRPAPLNLFHAILELAGSFLRICLTLDEETEEKLTMPGYLEDCKGLLMQSGILHSSLGRPVAEMLIRVAQRQTDAQSRAFRSGVDTSDCGNNGEDMLHWNLEELQEAVSSDSQSEVSDLLSTEEGYEADSEREKEGIHSADEGEVDLDRFEVTLSQHTLLYPQVCLLLMELLEGSSSDGGEFPAEVACYSIKQVIAIARSSQACQNSLYEWGLPRVVMQNYRKTVSPGERALLLELFAVLVQHTLSTAELREFLQLFQTDPSAMDENLISTLLTIVNTTTPQPSHILSFPIIKPLPETLYRTESLTSTTSTLTDTKILPSDHKSHQARPGPLKCPWRIAPVQLPIPSNLAWPPTGKGFFVATWLKVDEMRVVNRLHAVPGLKRKRNIFRALSAKLSQDSLEEESLYMYNEKKRLQRKEPIARPPAAQHDDLHLISVGNQDLTLQVWIEARTCRLTIRLVHFLSASDYIMLHESTCSGLLSLGVWQHLSLAYDEKVDGSTQTGTISVIVNGQIQRDILTEYTVPGQTKLSQSLVPYCLLGHCVQEGLVTSLPHGSWKLGNVLLFNDARVLTQELAFHLYTMGPDCVTISACEGSKQTRLYSQYITQEVLQSALSIDVISGDREVELRPARESLVVSYSPSNQAILNHYDAPAQPSSTLGRVLGGQPRGYLTALLQCPTTIGATLLCPISPSVHHSLPQAVMESGGVGVFVFLLANIVESCTSMAIQSKALKLLLRLRTCSRTLTAEFNDMMVASMISRVLVTPRCIVGFEMLKVMLDACLSKPILYRCSQTSEYRIHQDTQAIIQDTSLVSQLLLDWHVWEKTEPGVLAMLFHVMELLIEPQHPFQAFNITQLQSIRCVKCLLMICKERHHENLPSLTPQTSASIVSIIKGLMGLPPDIHLMAEVCDFLLAIHPAVNTFVCHAQSSFYFSQHSFTKQRNKQELLKRSYSGISQQSPTLSESPRFYVSSEDLRRADSNCGSQTSVTTPDIDSAESKFSSQAPFSSPSASASEWEEGRVSNMTGLCSGLLELLAEALVKLPDSSLSKVLGIVLKPETLIVLAHHSSPVIRTKVIQLLDVFFHRANSSQIDSFLKRRSFHLLANQLHQYATTRELMEACLTITVGKPVDLTQGVELMLLQESNRFHHFSSILVISLLENAVHDFNLCHDGICIANQLFEGIESIANAMLSNGLVETLCNVLSAVCSSVAAKSFGKSGRQMSVSSTISRRSDTQEGTAGQEITGTTRKDINDGVSQGSPRDDHVEFKVGDSDIRTMEGNVDKNSEKSQENQDNRTKSHAKNGRGSELAETSEPETTHQNVEREKSVATSIGSPEANGFISNAPREIRSPDAAGTPVISSNLETSGSGVGNVSAVSRDSVVTLFAEDTEVSETTCTLVKDVQHFMACIANRIFSSTNQFDYFENMMQLLAGMEEKLKARYGPSSIIPDIVYETQCYIVKEVLDHFRATSMAIDSAVTKGRKSLSLQRSVSYSERKYEEYKWKRHHSLDFAAKGMTGLRERFASTGSVGSTEFGLSHISESSVDDTMSITSELDILSNFGVIAEDRRYSSQLDTILRMQRVQAFTSSGRPTSKRKSPEVASEQLLAKRFQRICLLTVNLVVQRDPSRMNPTKSVTSRNPEGVLIMPVESTFTQLAKRLFHLLTAALSATMEKKLGQRKQWESILWSSRDTLRLQLHRLLVHMIAPWQPTANRVYVLQIVGLPRASNIIQSVFNSNLQHLGKFELFLFDLLYNHGTELTEGNLVLSQQLMDGLERSGFHPLYPEDMDATSLHRVKIELEKMVTEERSAQEAYTKQWLDGAVSAWTKLDQFAREIANSAMEVTQLVAAYQNQQRQHFLEFLKSTIANSLDVRSAWQDLIESLTHERTVWYDPQSYPPSWQLDPTEGPGRVRRRLQRCHLNIPTKFFVPSVQPKHAVKHPVPLGYLFEDSKSSNSSEFKRRLQKNEKISNAFFCKLVTPATVNNGDLLQGVHSMYFVSEELPDSSKTQVNPFERDMLTISWLYEDIKELHLRWYQLRDNALEIFLTNGQTLLLAFENTKERDNLYQQIKSCDLPNLIEVDDISDVTQAWRLGQMTNYEYLTQLNKLSGRSFNDLMQYPVFPFVLSDYTSKVLDLENPASFRDLTRPVAVQLKSMEGRYRENYKFLKEEYQKLKGNKINQTMFWTKPYHYGSHYSNSGTVLQYLVRLPPFTKMFLHYQDNHFDLPDRTFHSVDTSWRLSSFQSSTDVKELIPEFFFLPEFLVNNEGYNFGVRQSGNVVCDVILPPWAEGDARLFTMIHRQALESVYTSQCLHAWVDLVFGVKQKGTLAVEAVNVFHPATYFGIDTTIINDLVRQRAVETMIKTYGQTPKQLFVNYHPCRLEHDIVPESFGLGSVGILTGLAQRQFTKANTGPEASNIMGPVSTVKGMRWGNYLGSASGPDPVIRYQKQYSVPLTTLVPLPTGDICGVAHHLCLLLMYSKEKGVSSMNAVDIKWSGIVSWGHPDAILRVQIKRKSQPINLLHTTPTNKITCCSSVSDCGLLFIGTMAGIITAYPTRYNPDKQCNIEVEGAPVHLFGHTSRITSLCVCRPYSIMVSVSQDGLCVIWDLNRLCYVRSLDDTNTIGASVSAIAVSDVSGDIAVATDAAEGGSFISLCTVNARLVTQRPCDSAVQCLAFSGAPEGIAVNSLVAGCEDGVIRYWSTIDLTPIRVLVANTHSPIVSIAFTTDSQFLLASNKDGLVMVWGHKESNRRLPKVEAFLGTRTSHSPATNNKAVGSP